MKLRIPSFKFHSFIPSFLPSFRSLLARTSSSGKAQSHVLPGLFKAPFNVASLHKKGRFAPYNSLENQRKLYKACMIF